VLQYERKIFVGWRGDRLPTTPAPEVTTPFPGEEQPTVELPLRETSEGAGLTGPNTYFEDFSPGDIIVTYAHAQLRKDNLLFAIVPGRESFSRATRSTSYYGKQRVPVWLSLPTVEITGELHAAGRTFDIEMFLAKSTGDHIGILNATARSSLYPDVTFSGEAFLVNKHWIDLFCQGEPRSG